MDSKRFNTPLGRVFDVFNVIFLGLIALVMILPFLYILAGSFATETELTARSFFIWPNEFSVEAYRYTFSTPTFLRSLFVTVGVTVVGTMIQLFATLTMAYPLSRTDMPGRKFFLNMVIFCMLFSGGMIPTFLVVKNLKLLDSYWALILPIAVSPFNLLIIKNFFQELPKELEEAARIDGCSDIGVFAKIILPLSKPTIATFTLFYAVGIWNDFMSGLLYISDNKKWPIQLLLRQITMSSSGANALGTMDMNYTPPEQGIKFAVIVIATVPILLFYPFLQKHFAKGLLVGSVKG